MRSLDAKARRSKGQPLSAGKFASVGNKTSWVRAAEGGFEWVSDDLAAPTAVIAKTASGWNAQIWSDGTAEDSLNLGNFSHSEQARRVVARVVTAHVKFADEGDVDLVGGPFEPYAAPDSISGGGDNDPYSADGAPEPLVAEDGEQQGSAGVQNGTTRVGSLSAFAEHDSMASRRKTPMTTTTRLLMKRLPKMRAMPAMDQTMMSPTLMTMTAGMTSRTVATMKTGTKVPTIPETTRTTTESRSILR
jgi:hypothetical protein